MPKPRRRSRPTSTASRCRWCEWKNGSALVLEVGPQAIPPVLAIEHRADRRMVDRLIAVVGQKVLLADVSDVAALGILGEEMVERLVLRRAHRLRDRLVPFLAVGK